MKTPRILAFMGSGETAPTMVTPHRDIVARFGAAPPKAVLLDTPYGFQENAAEVSQRAVEYFAKRVQLTIDAAGYPGPLAADPAQRSAGAEAAALARLRTANLIFAGPGSPSYALSVWRGSPIPEALATRITEGAALVFASAAVSARRLTSVRLASPLSASSKSVGAFSVGQRTDGRFSHSERTMARWLSRCRRGSMVPSGRARKQCR